ncbi:MAG: DNA-processing protein DprA [Candidatus Paceibacterota bacterium]
MQELTPDEFPELLKEIPDPPEALFLKGKLPPQGHKLLSVVGSRKYTEYGKHMCESLITDLAGAPLSIISGLALGIDGIAHKSALRAGIHTIAVPGSGLGNSVLYPSSHKQIAKSILENGGALISPFPENFKATPYSFPERNRIMAGMSHAVLVIEAQERSGTLITSRLAVEYNRDVLTIPHPLTSPTGKGPHMLLRLGATLIRDGNDILEALGIQKEEMTNASPTLEHLSPDEKKAVALLFKPISKNELLEQLNMPIGKATMLITTLELKGIVVESLGLLYLQTIQEKQQY